MGENALSKVFGSRNKRLVKRMLKTVKSISAMEKGIQDLDDDGLRAKTVDFQQRYQQGESLDSLLPEAFAVVREGGIRALGMRHFDVQLVGAMVLHDGKIAEMRTGEGKTLVATLAVYLNALTGKGVHLITVNDYLAERDAAWMGQLYEFLGLSVGVIFSGQNSDDKRAAYACDITYGTNNEFGFDYLRDNMASRIEQKVQRGLHFAIVDEVDSILIDEARTPLIISGPSDEGTELYEKINVLIPQFERGVVNEEDKSESGDYIVEEKTKQVHLTEAGQERAEELLIEAGLLEPDGSLYDPANIALLHHLGAGLRAHAIYKRNVEYIVRDGQVIIVDEFTGRTMPGRRWSDGLHQAVEAKEGLEVQRENQTMASITFQNYFRLYEKLGGMTGTADTEAVEFQEIYGLEVVVIPTNRPIARIDQTDLIYMTADDKYQAIADDIKERNISGQPVLVGTASIEVSEILSEKLNAAGIKHEVLNAKQHEREALIIAQAGTKGAVTIATNMAGRGTDIVLGGNAEELIKLDPDMSDSKAEQLRADAEQAQAEVKAIGGLYVIGSERHESRRIDNQLRGRSGRQGDPGETRFYLSLNDSLMRIFASPRMAAMMQKLGLEQGEAIEHRWVNRAIENAQKKVEGHNFDARKSLLEYDDVANEQRKAVYERRDELMAEDDVSDVVANIREDVLRSVVVSHMPPNVMESQWDIEGLRDLLRKEFGADLPIADWLEQDDKLNAEGVHKKVVAELENIHGKKEELVGMDRMRVFERLIFLEVLDQCWKEHLAAVDYLRQGIGLRSYAQKNPRQEYRREAFELFQEFLNRIKYQTLSNISLKRPPTEEEMEAIRQENERRRQQELEYQHQAAATSGADSAGDDEHAALGDKPQQAAVARANVPKRPKVARGTDQTYVRPGQKIGRNDPCPCGSGKKYKQCHGKLN